MDIPFCTQIVTAMREGGFYDNIMSSGPELDRMKQFLQMMAGEREEVCHHEMQRPNFPCFPGLRPGPFFDDIHSPGAEILKDAFDTIRQECLNLHDNDYFRYVPVHMPPTWAVYLFHHMGVEFETLHQRCPETMRIISSLPRLAVDYPWADAAFSLHEPQGHLRAHCSVDNFRLRCHMGIKVPDDCEIRVGPEIRPWQEGQFMLFDDSIEHEVWNRSAEQRVVMIIDFWHPDLTDIETRAISAGFRKSEVRNIFCKFRIGKMDRPQSYMQRLEDEVERQDQDPLLREFWPS